MVTYNDLEAAYRQNMFAREGDKKETLVDMYKEIEDTVATGDSGSTLYHLAARFIDYPAIEYLSAQGVKARNDDYSNTALHALAQTPYGNNVKNYSLMSVEIYKTAKALLDAGVNPKKKNDDGKIAYMIAGQSCMYPFIKAMAEAGLKMDGVGGEGKNLVLIILDALYHRKSIEGVKENAYETIKILIESGSVDPEDKDIFGRDAHNYAQSSGVKEIAAFLSGDETATKTGGMTLTRAILSNDIEAVKAILESGSNPDEVEEQQRTPLMWACEYPKPEVVKLLLQHKADPNYVVGETGETAMTYVLTKSIMHVNGSQQSIRSTYLSIIRSLVDSGLDLNSSIDKDGNTALIYVAGMDYFCGLNNTIAEELIDNGADVNKTNLMGVTPLMAFAGKGDEQEHNIAELLLDNDADPTLTDKASNTALMYASGNSNKMSGKKIAELILDAGYKDLERTNNKGQSAMDIAVSNQNEALVKLLIMNM